MTLTATTKDVADRFANQMKESGFQNTVQLGNRHHVVRRKCGYLPRDLVRTECGRQLHLDRGHSGVPSP